MLFAPQADLVPRFADAYRGRRSDSPKVRSDAAIRRSLEILEQAVMAKLKKQPNPSAKTADGWLVPFRKAIGARDPMASDYARLSCEVGRLPNYQWIAMSMGSATRLAVRRPSGERLRLPSEFDYQTPWGPTVYQISQNLLLVSEDSIQDAGMRVGARLVLLRVKGSKAEKVGQFTARTTLDYASIAPKGRRVEVVDIAPPKTLRVSSSEATLGVRYTFECRKDGLKPIRKVRLQPEVWTVDEAIAAAWRAQRPTSLQQTIRKFIPPGEKLDETPEVSVVSGAGHAVRLGPHRFLVQRGRLMGYEFSKIR